MSSGRGNGGAVEQGRRTGRVKPGGGDPVLQIRRGDDNEEPLRRPFPVAPGRYDLRLKVNDMDEDLPVGEDIETKAGETVKFETGL